jgi:predicted AlkP superfamily pyrophosphatase or phosphodiesterase
MAKFEVNVSLQIGTQRILIFVETTLAMVKYTFIFLFSFFLSNTAHCQSKEIQYESEYFVILVIDGPRYSETYGDTTCKYIPNLCTQLKPYGTFFSNFKNDGPTLTVPGHTAIMTGNYQHISNIGGQLPKNPSLFQYYIKEKHALSKDAQVIASKGKLNVLSNTRNKKWRDTYLPYSYCGPNGNGLGYGDDFQTMQKVTESLSSSAPPHLMLINLLGVDVEGHANHWEKYLENIQLTDVYALQLWNTIQENASMRNKTTLFITNDHGRHLPKVKNGFVSHGDGCEGCRHISLLVLGPDVAPGKEITKKAELIDIPETIARMLGIDFPTGKGDFLEEIFIETKRD